MLDVADVSAIAIAAFAAAAAAVVVVVTAALPIAILKSDRAELSLAGDSFMDEK